MIRINWHYRPYRSKVFHGERGTSTSFSVNSAKKGEDGEWYNVWLNGDFPVEKGDGTELTLTAITGVKSKTVNGRTYVDIYAEGNVTKDGKDAFGRTDAEYAELESTVADLPF